MQIHSLQLFNANISPYIANDANTITGSHSIPSRQPHTLLLPPCLTVRVHAMNQPANPITLLSNIAAPITTFFIDKVPPYPLKSSGVIHIYTFFAFLRFSITPSYFTECLTLQLFSD